MKVIIPLAGKGTRLRPHTHITPKPMLKIAGKPVIDYVMDDLQRLGNVEQVIYITGHLKDKVEEYARAKYPFPSVFIEQKVQDGTAGAVALAKPYVDQPVFIIFVDTIFDADLSVVKRTDADGIIWVKTVEDYQRFGVVVTDDRRQHDEDRREADDADLEAREHRAVLHQELEAALRGHRVDAQAAEEQGRVLPDRRVPVHDRPWREDQSDRRRRLVRRGRAGHAARHESHDAREGARADADVDSGRRARSIEPVYIEDDVTLACVDDRAERLDRRRQPGRGLDAERHDRRDRRDRHRLDAHVVDDRRRGDRGWREGPGERERPLRREDREVTALACDARGSMISVRELTKLYGDFTAVRSISFDVGAGEVLGLVGPNGAGQDDDAALPRRHHRAVAAAR